MMHVFAYEYTCAVGPSGADNLTGLGAEGCAMLVAILADLARVPEVTVTTLLSEHLAVPAGPWSVQRLSHARDEANAFRKLAARADWTLVIAPECDGLLLERCRWVLAAGGRLLGPDLAAIELTGDKLALAKHLLDHGVPTPACHPEPQTFPAIWKPRHGAGSQATFLVRDPSEVAAVLATARAEGWSGESLWQPYHPGLAASVAFLLASERCLPLLPATQEFTTDGRFHYRGGRIPLQPDMAARAIALGERALATIPDLCGYIGLDLVLGPTPSQDVVIEINPRLTTSYVGLRALAVGNLAETMLRLISGGSTTIEWRPGRITFGADGTTTRHC
jgi:predicted ATP-grasp superfamily ATP-dependent carboligase